MVNKAGTYISQLERNLIKKPDYETAKLILEVLDVSENKIQEVFKEYGIQINSPSINKIKQNVMLNDEFETKCEKDAEEIHNLILSLPIRTQEIIKDLLLKN